VTWDPRHLPSQVGKTFVVTGGNAGIGYFTVEQLAAAGGRVIIAARNHD
jgi:NAD(P)-dependent dehydrogenase (short-subunit alcohol dehydrogenase family)